MTGLPAGLQPTTTARGRGQKTLQDACSTRHARWTRSGERMKQERGDWRAGSSLGPGDGSARPLRVPSCAPSPAQAAWAQTGAVPTSSSSSPILMEKGSTAEKTRRTGKTARNRETQARAPESRCGRMWTPCGIHQ